MFKEKVNGRTGGPTHAPRTTDRDISSLASGAKNGKFSNSRGDNSDSSGPIIELIRNLIYIYILPKFGADWLIFVDARMLTRKLWTDTDGQ